MRAAAFWTFLCCLFLLARARLVCTGIKHRKEDCPAEGRVLLQSAGRVGQRAAAREEGSPPPEITGRCTGSCVKNAAYPCTYVPTYPVWFWANGSFNWQAPYADGSAVEIGHGRILSSVIESRQANGSWQASWYGGNRYIPDPLQVTHCACYYAKGTGKGMPWLLSNYGIANVQNSSHLSVEAVCRSHWTQCPTTNTSAFRRWGRPWIEIYLGCRDWNEKLLM